MALIPYAAPATEQPQGATPEIDWANPLNEGLVFCVPLSDGFSEIVGDYGSGTITGTVLDAPTAQGRGADFNGSSYLEYGSANIVPDTTPITITLYEECRSAVTYGMPFGLVKGAHQWLFLRSPNSSYFCALGWSGGSPQNFVGLGAAAAGEKIRFVITLPNGLASATGARLWANGVEYTASSTSLGGAGAGTNKVGWSGYNGKWDGLLADFTIRARIWTDDEVESYFERPGQIYRGASVLVPVSAGGGSTITATVSVSAAIQAAQAATASVNAAIQATQSASASVNAAVAQARTVQAALDAAVLQARNTTATVDAAVQRALTNTASVDAVIQAASSASSSVNAAVQAGQSATTSVNAYVQAGAGLVASIDAYIQAGNSHVASVDAVIQQSRTGNATIDAVVSRALTASASLAAAVLDHRTATAGINAYIQAGTTIGAGIEAAIQAQQSASASINAAVSVARLASLGLAAAISVHSSVGAAVDAAVLHARSGAMGVGAYIFDADAIVTESEWWRYEVLAQDLRYTIPASDNRFEVAITHSHFRSRGNP